MGDILDSIFDNEMWLPCEWCGKRHDFPYQEDQCEYINEWKAEQLRTSAGLPQKDEK